MKFVVAFMVLVAVAGAQAQSAKSQVFENLAISEVAPVAKPEPKKIPPKKKP